MRLLILLGAFSLLLSHQATAKSNIHLKDVKGFGVFVKHETNDTDNITGVGISQRVNFHRSELGAEFTTNINYAEVLTESGYLEEFMAWEGGVKLGYFSTVFVYVEAGIDLAELFVNDRDDDDCCRFFDKQDNDPDGYAGLGLGVQLQHLRVEAFARARQIDSYYWRNESQAYYGFQLSLGF